MSIQNCIYCGKQTDRFLHTGIKIIPVCNECYDVSKRKARKIKMTKEGLQPLYDELMRRVNETKEIAKRNGIKLDENY